MSPALKPAHHPSPLIHSPYIAYSLREPRMDDIDRTVRTGPYKGAAGGWGSARSLGNILRREGVLLRGAVDLMKQNKADGFSCVSCAWPKPAKANTFEYCENGAKATVWEITTHRTTPDFFAKHTCAELRGWEDYYLEQQGRLTHPMRYDAARCNRLVRLRPRLTRNLLHVGPHRPPVRHQQPSR
jgi:hypothetical protein